MGPGAELSRFMRDERVEPRLVELIAAVATATERIEALVRRSGLTHLIGLTGATNVQDEAVHKLDDAANRIFVDVLRASGRASLLVSEELAEPLALGGGPFALYVDPIDGSSNADVNGSIGSIFSVHASAHAGLPGPGHAQRAAGYVMYGPGTSMMITWGRELHEFVLDPDARGFLLTRAGLRLPPSGRTYAVNFGRRAYWDPGVGAFFDDLNADDPARGRPYSLRYSGSLTADLHRILLEGGIYCYPGDRKVKDGKLRLLYEACPLALLAEQGGGRASNGHERILDIVPRTVHQRVPLYIGSATEVELAEDYVQQRRRAR
ncbi:MAG: fructose-bisphosphatase class I [Candidatus Rokuibacteriota bacterium]|nr:MAG: fructose-bisphosphatase class I [Candidatus Rokubacteria bacterium]